MTAGSSCSVATWKSASGGVACVDIRGRAVIRH
jgi:hypothetical protein